MESDSAAYRGFTTEHAEACCDSVTLRDIVCMCCDREKNILFGKNQVTYSRPGGNRCTGPSFRPVGAANNCVLMPATIFSQESDGVVATPCNTINPKN